MSTGWEGKNNGKLQTHWLLVQRSCSCYALPLSIYLSDYLFVYGGIVGEGLEWVAQGGGGPPAALNQLWEWPNLQKVENSCIYGASLRELRALPYRFILTGNERKF